MNSALVQELTEHLIKIISETNGIGLDNTLELACQADHVQDSPDVYEKLVEFRKHLSDYQQDRFEIKDLLAHPVALALGEFLKKFPLSYCEEHIHLTGSLTAEFIFPRLMKLFEQVDTSVYEQKIKEVYGDTAWPIKSVEDVDRLIRLHPNELFDRYLKILYLSKLILISREAHRDAAYHLASELYKKYNVGRVRLKFTLSRKSDLQDEQIPGVENLSTEDVVLGLYDGFMDYKKENPKFEFVLSPSFRKESEFFDSKNFKNKREHFMSQVDSLLELLEQHPELGPYLKDVDTVGNERNFYRKNHFTEMQYGFRKLQKYGFQIRSHHGETWHTLRRGVQAVDNAMNIWHIDALEHALSLGLNPNYYFHNLYQRIVSWNKKGKGLAPRSAEYNEVMEMDWNGVESIRDKLINGIPLSSDELIKFVKIKLYTAREVEYYQHDILNRMMAKKLSLVALPSSNKKLTSCFPDYKDHPFSWWEKKGVELGVGTDNYVTLDTNFIKEMIILLLSDPYDLKIAKLLMVTTGEKRRPYVQRLLWSMRKNMKRFAPPTKTIGASLISTLLVVIVLGLGSVACSTVKYTSKGQVPVFFSTKDTHKKVFKVEDKAHFYLWGLVPKEHVVSIDEEAFENGFQEISAPQIKEYLSGSDYALSVLTLGLYTPRSIEIVAKGI